MDDLGFPVTDDVIRIMPVVIGSKSGGLLQVILERCWWLLRSGQAAHQWLPGSTANRDGHDRCIHDIGWHYSDAVPAAKRDRHERRGENKPSYAFGAPTNTVSQGYPVPIGYGKRRIGGAVISAGIYVEDQQ